MKVSRSSSLSNVNTVRPVENRSILVALGIEFHNPGFIKTDLKSKFKKLVVHKDGSGTYLNTAQGVRYMVKVATHKNDLKDFLERGGVHVIYDGHARYGRGPCFGEKAVPGDDWEDGIDPDKTGIFRMGYKYLPIEISDILHHKYQANLVKATGDDIDADLPREDCHPDLLKYYKQLRPMILSRINKHLSGYVVDSDDPDQKYWAYVSHFDEDEQKKYTMTWVVLHAGWKDTSTYPMEIGATGVESRAFCHFGCSSQKHNQDVFNHSLDLGWRMERGHPEMFTYWCDRPSQDKTSLWWVENVLRYNKPNAFTSWNDVLEYARVQTNKDIRAKNYRYKIAGGEVLPEESQ